MTLSEAAQQGAVEIGEAGRLDAQFKPFTVGVGSSSATPSQYFSSGISVDEQGACLLTLVLVSSYLKTSYLMMLAKSNCPNDASALKD